MLNRNRFSTYLPVLTALALLAHTAPASAAIVPADRMTVWNPGVPGGIPGDGDATRPATVWLPSGDPYAGYSVNPALGNGSTDATSAINSAINSAGSAATANARKIVFLAPGTYRTNGIVSIGRSNVTLRGSGQRVTIIDHRGASDWAAISIGSSVGDFSSTPVVNVVGGALKGAAQITVADASRFNVGDILQIDQLADGTENGPVGWVWKLDSWWSMRSPYSDFAGGGGLQGKFPDSPGGYRPISQRIEVLAKSGNTLTIYDPGTRRGSPLHIAFPAAQDPEVWRAAGGTADVVRYTGLESLSVWSAANPGDAKDMVAMNGAAFSWIKDIETDGSKNTWAGRHIHIGNAVYKSELRGSYSHNSSNYNQGSNAYGILYSGSDCLIEDNIVRELNKPVVGETAGGGNVIAYNYVDEAIIGSLTNNWQETAINMSHGSFCHSDLFEGNHTPNVGVDSTHGNNGWGVIFRNWATGRNGSGRTNTYLRAIYVDGWNREMTSIGNVLGSASFKPTYQILSPRTGVNPVYGGVSSIYLLGSNAWELSTGRKPGADYMDDGQAEDLFYRHLDFDTKTNTQYDEPTNPEKTLPNSLYLTGKPAFFGALPWPWVNPGAATKVQTLPAKARYDAMGSSTYALTVTRSGSGTVTSSPAGISCGATCTASFSSGTAVTLTATPAAGSTFGGWSGACSGTGACQVTMSAARAVTATFSGSAAPSLSIGNVTVNEGQSGTVAAVFTVTLSPSSAQTVTVNFATANGTATAGSDYVAQTGNLTFTAGQTTKTISVTVNGDTTSEPNETFFVNLSSASGATLADAQGQATITNDDVATPPKLSVSDVTLTEGHSGTSNATFTVTLSAPSASTVTARFATGNGTATAGSDYVAKTGTLTFTAGQTSKTVNVTVNGDTRVERDESFLVNLSSASGATLLDGRGRASIMNDDGRRSTGPRPTLIQN